MTSGHATRYPPLAASNHANSAASFDAVVMNLILSVVPDGAAAFAEAWRALRPGGRAVIFDKFLAEDGRLSPLRRAIGRLSPVGNRPQPPPERHLSAI